MFFVFAIAAAYVGIRLFRRMISMAHEKNLRRYPVFAFVLCLLLAYCAEEFFGVADIIDIIFTVYNAIAKLVNLRWNN